VLAITRVTLQVLGHKSLPGGWMAGDSRWALLHSWTLNICFKSANELREPTNYQSLTTGVAADSIYFCRIVKNSCLLSLIIEEATPTTITAVAADTATTATATPYCFQFSHRILTLQGVFWIS